MRHDYVYGDVKIGLSRDQIPFRFIVNLFTSQPIYTYFLQVIFVTSLGLTPTAFYPGLGPLFLLVLFLPGP